MTLDGLQDDVTNLVDRIGVAVAIISDGGNLADWLELNTVLSYASGLRSLSLTYSIYDMLQ